MQIRYCEENMKIPFATRRKAGEELATKLRAYANRKDVLVLGLPRGGVPVAYEVARALRASLDVFVVRKLGVPGQEELAMGAIAMGGVCVVNKEITAALGIPDSVIDTVARQEQRELERRERLYRGDRASSIVQGRIVILVDDGLATGSTMRAAAIALRQMQPAKLVVAVPVGAPETCGEFHEVVDEVVCAITPETFVAVSEWYLNFSQTSDKEVRGLLKKTARSQHDILCASHALNRGSLE